MGEHVGREFFAERVGATLEAGLGEQGAVTLLVQEIQDFGTADGTRFSVFLTGPGEQCLPQGIYQVTAAGGRTFDLFLVPVASEEDGYRYEATFNRDGG